MRAYQSLSDEAFCTHLNQRIGALMSLAVYVSENDSSEGCFTRPLLADLLSEASKIEELLDAYGVKNNRHWFPLRQAVAPIKLFSKVSPWRSRTCPNISPDGVWLFSIAGGNRSISSSRGR